MTWSELENFIKDLFSWNNSEKTKGSGNLHDDADVITENFLIECKNSIKNKNFIITPQDLLLVERQASSLGRLPLLIHSNKDDKTIVSMDVETFSKIMEDVNELKGSK